MAPNEVGLWLFGGLSPADLKRLTDLKSQLHLPRYSEFQIEPPSKRLLFALWLVLAGWLNEGTEE